MANICADKPTFVADLNVSDTFSLTLKPVAAIDGEDQYWPLYNAASPGEEFGNMLFKFNGKNGTFTLNITLDTSEVADATFVDNSGNLDGVVGLSPNFKHEFKSKVDKKSGATQLEITIKNKDNKRDEDAIKDIFSFLWLCQSPAMSGQFKSGDPDAQVEPL